MMKYYLLRFVVIATLFVALFGCKKEDHTDMVTTPTTMIYGTVFNSKQGDPVLGAEISLRIKYYYAFNFQEGVVSSSVSGSDGQYELILGEIEHGDDDHPEFAIIVEKEGFYADYKPISITFGGVYHVDLNLEPQRKIIINKLKILL